MTTTGRLADEILLRRASKIDSRLIYELSIDRLVRANSFETKYFTFDEHNKWLTKKLSDPSFVLLLGFYRNDFVGQVKFSIESDVAVIGISIAEPFRGRGIAKTLMEKGIMTLLSFSPAIKKIKAYIKKDNIPSIKLFEKCAFTLQGIEMVKRIEANVYLRNV